MNYALILAGGAGQRMRSTGMPKQFVKLYGKPIIVYTLEKFELSEYIDKIIIVCRDGYLHLLSEALKPYDIKKVGKVIVGGIERQESLKKGLAAITELGGTPDDIIVIHDGVRPMVSPNTIKENITTAQKYGCAITVRPVTETVVISDADNVNFDDFKKRSDTYSLTSPQTFKLGNIVDAFRKHESRRDIVPLLDAAMVYAAEGNYIQLVKEYTKNIKITTPEDFYYLKAMVELEENKFIFGL